MTVTLHIQGSSVQAPKGVSVMAAMANAALDTTRTSVCGTPRSALCGMGVCQECRVSINGQRRLACQTPVEDGMVVQALDDTAPAEPAHAADKAADKAVATTACPSTRPAPPPETTAPTPPCDVLVLGAGPAGLEAALAAAESGAQVLLVDDNPLPGGQIWRQRPGQPSPAQALAARIDALPQVRRCSGVRALGFPAPGQVLLEDAHRAWLQPYRALVLCSGARELLLPFPGWTLPGVTGAGGLQALVKAGTDVAKQRVVVAGSGPLLLAVAATLRGAGAQVPVVAEQAPWSALASAGAALWRWPSKAMQAAQLFTPAWRSATMVVQALGDERLQAVRLRQGGREWVQRCERLACGFGLVPNTELAQALGCALSPERAVVVDALQATSLPGVWAAGECTGIGGSERARVQGRIAGYAASGHAAQARAAAAALPRWQAFANTVQRAFALGDAVRGLADDATVLCRCEDVAVGDVRAARGWVDAKLHSRCGMGPCQGRVCGAAAHTLWGWAPPAPQMPVAPARIDSLLQLSIAPHAHP